MKHTGTLIMVRDALKVACQERWESDTTIYEQALQKLDDLIADVPDGLKNDLIGTIFVQKGCEAIIPAAKLLSEAVEVGE